MDDLEVRWRGAVVGWLCDARPDMWLLDGRWRSASGPGAAAFESLAAALDPAEVMRDPIAGTRVELLSPGGSEPVHALVLGLADGRLSVRRVLRPEAIAWLLEHVR